MPIRKASPLQHQMLRRMGRQINGVEHKVKNSGAPDSRAGITQRAVLYATIVTLEYRTELSRTFSAHETYDLAV